jgi:hypothetical protein
MWSIVEELGVHYVHDVVVLEPARDADAGAVFNHGNDAVFDPALYQLHGVKDYRAECLDNLRDVRGANEMVVFMPEVGQCAAS